MTVTPTVLLHCLDNIIFQLMILYHFSRKTIMKTVNNGDYIYASDILLHPRP